MSVVAFIRRCIAAGMDFEDALQAAEQLEPSDIQGWRPSAPSTTAAAERMRRYRDNRVRNGLTPSFNARAVLPTLRERDGEGCAYCLTETKAGRGGMRDTTVDHVVPTSKGGTDATGNLVEACRACNGKKAGLLLSDAGMKLQKPSALAAHRAYLKGKHCSPPTDENRGEVRPVRPLPTRTEANKSELARVRDNPLDLFLLDEDKGSDANASDGCAVVLPFDGPSVDLRKRAWDAAVRVIRTQGGKSDGAARSIFGRILSQHGIGAELLLPALASVELAQSRDPVAYLSRTAQFLAGTGPPKATAGMLAAASDEIAFLAAIGEIPRDAVLNRNQTRSSNGNQSARRTLPSTAIRPS